MSPPGTIADPHHQAPGERGLQSRAQLMRATRSGIKLSAREPLQSPRAVSQLLGAREYSGMQPAS